MTAFILTTMALLSALLACGLALQSGVKNNDAETFVSLLVAVLAVGFAFFAGRWSI